MAPVATQQIEVSVLHGAHDLRTEKREIGAPGEDEVQVELKATTLCGSDLHYWNHGANGDFKVREPLSLGHESAGIVVAVGAGVSGLQVGDRVALEVGIACAKCKLCLAGKYHLCPDMRFRSSAKIFPHFQGTLQQRINHPAVLCHKIPTSVSYEEAALIEPLSVAIHAARRAGVQPGMSVLVFGAGAVGLFAAAMAKIAGATTIAIADIAKGRTDFALANGFATHSYVVPMKRGATTEEKLAIATETANDITALPLAEDDAETLGQFDVVFECTGVESCVQAGIFAAAPGGKLMFVGMGNPIQTLHIGAAALREVDLLGVFRYSNVYPTAIRLLREKRIPAFSKLVTHRVNGLENVDRAFQIAGKPVDEDGNLVIKAVINY
ncbi:uncharacterized protein V1510DRAFT_418441 [Dipodascopsis tothii]|uniref:uncharacterized protein n=1 Tax=Dipodascopsis tothii TaxID=44089 RepID=UPI0034D01589